MTPPLERPETPPRVREKLVESELASARLAGQVGIMGERVEAMGQRLDMLAEGQRELRSDLKEHERNNAKRDGEMRGEVAGMRKDLDARLDSIERTLTFCAGKEAGGGAGATPTLPNLGALTPQTSAGQARRAVAVGGGGLSLATLLGLLASLATLPVVVQWALGAVAVVAGLGAVAVAVRWGWRAAGR
jgi:hypothetical protein